MGEPDAPQRDARLGDAFVEDALLGGAVRLLQAAGGHRAGTDAVLLAQLADLRRGDRVVDLGSGSGAVALMLGRRDPAAELLLLERQPEAAELARRNVELNAMGVRARVVEADLFASRRERVAAGLPAGAADLVVTNPPFADRAERASLDPARRAAHAMSGGGLAEWLATAAECLKPRGRLHLIHRADRLADCLEALRPAFGSVRVTPVLPGVERDAVRVLIAAVRGGRAPLALAAPLVLMGEDGRFAPRAAALHTRPEFVGGQPPGLVTPEGQETRPASP